MEEDFRNVLEKRLSVDDLVYHGSLVAFHKNQLDRRADDMPLNDTTVMDMVIFRTIFFELFSFLHVHALYPPFRLLTNLGIHPRTRQKHCIRMADSNGTNHEHVLLLLLGCHRGIRLLFHRVLLYRRKSRNENRGYYPCIVLYDLLSHR